VPFLLKDLGQDLEGYPTSGGSRSLSTTPATENATVVQRWLDAGLVVFGKTNTPEFGAKGVTESHLFGPARNPWNTEHTPGGSSGGAAAAVAAGIVPCAAASDGGGSIRIPASACGLFGLKPSRGLVPSGPLVQEGLGGIATHGVISRSVRDTAAMLDVLVGGTPDSPYLPALSPTSYADEVGQDPGPLRIGLCTSSAINPKPHTEAVAAATKAGQLLESLGHHVEHLDSAPFDDEALARDFLTTWFVYAADSVAQAKAYGGADDSGFEPDTLVMAALGRATKPVDLVRSIENRQAHVRRLAEFHESFDLLLTPSTALPPPKIGALDLPPAMQKAQKGLVRVRGAGLLRFTPLVNQLISENLGWVPYTQLAKREATADESTSGRSGCLGTALALVPQPVQHPRLCSARRREQAPGPHAVEGRCRSACSWRHETAFEGRFSCVGKSSRSGLRGLGPAGLGASRCGGRDAARRGRPACP
jgi:Asp-tRNA(Asn)/Glu-tRNA(Gln) amidotransferase A subunit family amidase